MIEKVMRRLLGRKTVPPPPPEREHPLEKLELARAQAELADLQAEVRGFGASRRRPSS